MISSRSALVIFSSVSLNPSVAATSTRVDTVGFTVRVQREGLEYPAVLLAAFNDGNVARVIEPQVSSTSGARSIVCDKDAETASSGEAELGAAPDPR